MTVYVDNSGVNWHGRTWFHLMADSVEELHEFAGKLGLKPEWYQGRSIPHYDVVASKRRKALMLGAQAIGSAKVVELIRKFRAEAASDSEDTA